MESYQFHQLLASYGNEPEPTIVIKLVTKHCIPRLKVILDAYDVVQLNQTKMVVSLLNQLMDYCETSTPAFQVFLKKLCLLSKGLIEEFANRVKDGVFELCDRYDIARLAFKPAVNKDVLSNRDQWLGMMIEVIIFWYQDLQCRFLKVYCYGNGGFPKRFYLSSLLEKF